MLPTHSVRPPAATSLLALQELSRLQQHLDVASDELHDNQRPGAAMERSHRRRQPTRARARPFERSVMQTPPPRSGPAADADPALVARGCRVKAKGSLSRHLGAPGHAAPAPLRLQTLGCTVLNLNLRWAGRGEAALLLAKGRDSGS